MFGWIIPLLQSKQDDFWLNVFAGIPFLFFDVVIITLVLPKALEWFDQRKWRVTRWEAIDRIWYHYMSLQSAFDQIRRTAARYPPTDAQSRRKHEPRTRKEMLGRDVIVAQIQKLRIDVIAQLDATLIEADTIVQTSLPVLDPQSASKVLRCHFRWIRLAKGVRRYLDEMRESTSNKSLRSVAYVIESARHLEPYLRDLRGLQSVEHKSRLIWEQGVEWTPMVWYDDGSGKRPVSSLGLALYALWAHGVKRGALVGRARKDRLFTLRVHMDCMEDLPKPTLATSTKGRSPKARRRR